MRIISGFAVFLAAIVAAGSAAAAGLGKAVPWQLGFQNAESPIMEYITSVHTFVLWIIVIISLIVMGLLIAVMVKFNSKSNPEPSRTTHNTLVEIVWTVVPILILLMIDGMRSLIMW